MHIGKALQIIPYVAIVLANILYLYFFSSLDQLEWYQLFLFNFVIMVCIGAVLVIKINLLLHQWLVVEKEKDEKGNLTQKGIIKQKLQQLLKKSYLLQSLFLPGNQKTFLKIYFGLTVLRYLMSYIPGLLLTLLTFLFYQYKDFILPKIKPILNKINELFDKLCLTVLDSVPKYRKIKERYQLNEKNE